MKSNLLTVDEVAEFLRLKPRKIYDLVAKQEIPFARAGAKLVFAQRDIQQWLDDQRHHKDGPPGFSHSLPNTIAGSHDPLLEWAVRQSGSDLALMTRGSRDGLNRLANSQASAALIHLPSDDLQSFNLHEVTKVSEGHDWVLLHWAKREQGLVCASGNPRNIEGMASLKRLRLRMGRRQEGAGTRAILDLLCARIELARSPKNISWRDPFNTEDEIGAAIADGTIDCGLSVHSAAKRFQLHFIPVLIETVDLLVDRRAYFEPGLQALIRFAQSQAFRDKATKLGGYDLNDHGSVRWNAS